MTQAMFLLVMFCIALMITTGVSSSSRVPAPNCPDECGDVHIPYPFGIGPNCSLTRRFRVTCNEATSPPRLLMGNVRIKNITLKTAQMVVCVEVAYTCGRSGGNTRANIKNTSFNMKDSPFLLSPADNMFTAVGCRSVATIRGKNDAPYLTGCITTCASVNNTGDNGAPCSGQGCCEASLTPDLSSFSVRWIKDNRTPVINSPCQYAFVAMKGWYKFNQTDIVGNMTLVNRLGRDGRSVVPLVLDWAIRNESCPSPPDDDKAKLHVPYGVCVSTHSYCVNASNGAQPAYLCKCHEGYAGNPYIKDGCTNINECEPEGSPNLTMYENLYPCRGGTCRDVEGDYECKCNFGHRGDGKSDKGCEPILSMAAVAVIGTISAISISTLLLIFIQMEREKRRLRDHFSRNGGQLVKSIKITIFTKEKVDQITKNYNTIIGKGAFGEVYKGTTSQNVQVAVKRSITINKDRQKDFANEIQIQSQMSHKYLVQLLGCCLETEVPMLIYEFLPRGSLYDVLHGKNGNNRHPLSLGACLDIAVNSADAFAYMHSQASQKILHGDVKSGNILLDDDFVPKVSDFGTSRLMSIEKDHTNWVIGDSSYIDPVYMKTGLLTEKSDVYSFGIVLLELITGKKARYDGNNSLPLNYVKASMDGTAEQMHAMEIASTGEDVSCLEEVGLIAVQCLKNEVNDRPTMTEVMKKPKTCKRQWLQSHGQDNEICT